MEIAKNAALILALDAPWLYAISGYAGDVVREVQGTPLAIRAWPAVAVYVALGYLLSVARSVKQAFFMGLATYAVYDFTNVSIFKNYPLSFAAMDSLWGGTLMAAAFWLKEQFTK